MAATGSRVNGFNPRGFLVLALSALVSSLASGCQAEAESASAAASALGGACLGEGRGPIRAGTLAFSSGIPGYDAAYAKATEDISQDIVKGVFNAGESWAQVWTRDTSYSIDLGAGLLQPAAAKLTLAGMTQKDPRDGKGGTTDVWVQDVAGDFGGWPNLSDSIVGAQGAWSLYLTTGDSDLLTWSYGITVNTLARAERDVFIAGAGLFGGCSSFMESNSAYPSKYAGTKSTLAQTRALSTNLLYYRGYVVAAQMGRILGRDVTSFEKKAERLKNAINTHLWMEDVGYYAYFEDENGAQEKKMEGTGESFAVLWGVADAAKAERIFRNTQETPAGIPSLWPQYSEWLNYSTSESLYYHNGMVWPFVQGYWGWAAAAGGSMARFETELDRIRRLSESTTTFHEFYHPQDGLPDGSRRQLWSASGYLAMVYHGLIGMNFDAAGVRFAPAVPAAFHEVTLDGIPYRNMTLNVSVRGSGETIRQFLLDGVVVNDFRVPSTLTGTHRVDIVMASCTQP